MTSPSCSGSRSRRSTAGTGVAAHLLAGVVDAARRSTADRLLLEVREDNRGALAFYAGQGFIEIDRRPRYYADEATAVVLRRQLVRGCGGSEIPSEIEIPVAGE